MAIPPLITKSAHDYMRLVWKTVPGPRVRAKGMLAHSSIASSVVCQKVHRGPTGPELQVVDATISSAQDPRACSTGPSAKSSVARLFSGGRETKWAPENGARGPSGDRARGRAVLMTAHSAVQPCRASRKALAGSTFLTHADGHNWSWRVLKHCHLASAQLAILTARRGPMDQVDWRRLRALAEDLEPQDVKRRRLVFGACMTFAVALFTFAVVHGPIRGNRTLGSGVEAGAKSKPPGNQLLHPRKVTTIPIKPVIQPPGIVPGIVIDKLQPAPKTVEPAQSPEIAPANVRSLIGSSEQPSQTGSGQSEIWIPTMVVGLPDPR